MMSAAGAAYDRRKAVHYERVKQGVPVLQEMRRIRPEALLPDPFLSHPRTALTNHDEKPGRVITERPFQKVCGENRRVATGINARPVFVIRYPHRFHPER
jgi:hypothetical protein